MKYNSWIYFLKNDNPLPSFFFPDSLSMNNAKLQRTDDDRSINKIYCSLNFCCANMLFYLSFGAKMRISSYSVISRKEPRDSQSLNSKLPSDDNDKFYTNKLPDKNRKEWQYG